MVLITQLSLYVINRVKILRSIKGISGSKLSVYLKRTPAYVFNVEKNTLRAQYPPEIWPKLAEALKCAVHDLLPPDEFLKVWEGELINKKVLSFDNPEDAQLIITALISNSIFDQPKTLENIASHLYIEKEDQKQILKKVLDNIAEEGILNKHTDGYLKS